MKSSRARNPEDSETVVPCESSPTSDRDGRRARKRGAVLLGTANIFGDRVYDRADRLLGEIEELVFDVRAGRIAFVLVAVGPAKGTGRRLLAIPWSATRVDGVYPRCIVDIDLERLTGAPSLDGNLLLAMANPTWVGAVHAHFARAGLAMRRRCAPVGLARMVRAPSGIRPAIA